MKRSARNIADVNHHEPSKKQSIAGAPCTKTCLLQAQERTLTDTGTITTQTIRDIKDQVPMSMHEPPKHQRLLYESIVLGSQENDRQKSDLSSSAVQIQNSSSLFSHQAAAVGMTNMTDFDSVLLKAMNPNLSSSRNLSHLMLSPRGLSVQNELKLHVVEQQMLQQEQIKQAQVNNREAIIRAALAIQQEQQVNVAAIARNATLVLQQRHHQDMNRLRREIRIMEQIQNDRQDPSHSSAISISAITPTQVDTISNLRSDVHRALLGLNRSVHAPTSQELGILYPNQRLSSSLFPSSFQPQQQFPSAFNVASHMMGGTPRSSMLSMATPIAGTHTYNLLNVAVTAENAFFPVILGRIDTDGTHLSDHQRLLRQQIEIFEAGTEDVATHMRGRNKPISLGQVGLRCKHCAQAAVKDRQKGSTYYPSTMSGVYQAAQNMSSTHIANGFCQYLPASVTIQFAAIASNKQNSISSPKNGCGRKYWIHSVSQLGMFDTEEHGIRFSCNRS